ncbi:hypothetical protein ANTQUA_LOCUS6481 [Anthophora quadrimaculata]
MRGKRRKRRYCYEEEWEKETTEPRGSSRWPPTTWIVIPSRVFSTLATLLQTLVKTREQQSSLRIEH